MKQVRFVLIFLVIATFAAASQETERNKGNARKVIEEVLGMGRFDLVPELYSSEFVNHGRTRDVDLSVDQAAAHGWRDAFPDLKMTAEILVAESDLVAVLWRATGTNTGQGNGLPATGKSGQGRGITIWRFKDGKVVEEWSEFGILDMFRQLGLVPGETAAEPDLRSHVYEGPDQKIAAEELERNRQLASSVFEQIVGQGKLELFDSIYMKDFVNHGAHRDGTLQGEIEGTKGFRELAPDLKVKIDQTICEGDLVTILYSVQGTNTGAALGLPATGKPFALRGISMMRVRDGKIIEEWSILDQYSALVQLGLLSPESRPEAGEH